MRQKSIDLERTSLGIEFGSTRIKAVLIGSDYTSIASGEYEWESHLEEGIWTYDLKDVWEGLQEAFRQLSFEVKKRYGIALTKVGSMGISAMMHGYLPFDINGEQLVSFRTWRNTNTRESAEKLSSLFEFNIPQRWSIAHLYQAILNNEEHVQKIDFITTLAGYVHWKLTKKKVIGVGDASGIFPVDSELIDYDHSMIEQFNGLIKECDYKWRLKETLPEVKSAGDYAGILTEEGARLLDPSGILQAGIPICPPEGDAGTGMVATNSVSKHTGNVSAGTSVFAMVVLEKLLANYYEEIDMVTTPTGAPVAMVHCNNFTSDINDWVNLFAELAEAIDVKMDIGTLFTTLFEKSMEADRDLGGLISCNYFTGEPITGLEEGRPLFMRMPDSKLTLANFMRTHIYSALATLNIGMDILTKKEKVKIDNLLGHGGFFKTEKVGQQMMADALRVPVSVMNTAGEGGPWGIALLAAYSVNKQETQTLEEYLDQEVFVKEKASIVEPTEEGMESFSSFMKNYHPLLEVERVAIDSFK